MKYFWIFCVFGGNVGSFNLTVVLCELKVKGNGKCYFGLNIFCVLCTTIVCPSVGVSAAYWSVSQW